MLTSVDEDEDDDEKSADGSEINRNETMSMVTPAKTIGVESGGNLGDNNEESEDEMEGGEDREGRGKEKFEEKMRGGGVAKDTESTMAPSPVARAASSAVPTTQRDGGPKEKSSGLSTSVTDVSEAVVSHWVNSHVWPRLKFLYPGVLRWDGPLRPLAMQGLHVAEEQRTEDWWLGWKRKIAKSINTKRNNVMSGIAKAFVRK